ncbi:hypothetical protein BG005_008269 [Podila minutissima]|nr:hypothetical protein BG005_008269 [Podila minutissima]
MDGINFQGMSRMPLTATEEALIPRPPSSASQVATALPSTYTRFGSSHSLVSAPSFHSLNRLPLNTPTRQTQQYSSPASTSPTIPHGEQEYPQNPQDSYYSHSPAVSLRRGSHSQDTPLHQTHQDSWGSRMDSPTPMTESDDSDDEDDGEISRETDSSKERPSKPRTRRHLDHHHHHPRRSADLLRRLKQSTKLTFGGVEEGSHPGSGFPANNNNIHNQYISSHHRHPHRPQYHRSLDLHFQQSQDSPSGSRRTSREYSDEEKAFPLAPLHHPEPRRSRSAWRPSLSLIRQESSIHGQYPSIHGQYPQHDSRPLDNTSALNQLPIPEEGPKRHRTKQKKASKKDKTKKPIKAKKSDKKPKDRPMDILDDQSKNVLTMPNLQQVLEKKTSFPLGYDDFEAFLQSQRAAEYLNFWADVTAHEQLCRTFDVSERRQMRELQLEERAITRDKRRVALLQHADAHHSSDQTDHGQDLNNSNLYLTSRSSLQLPLTDHPSFPAENRRQHHFGPPSSSTPTSYNQMMLKRGSTDILAGTKASTGENRAGDLRRSTSQQQLSSEPHPNTLDEIAKLTKAVEESIQLSLANSDPGAPPLSVLESGLFRGPSTTFDQDIGPLQAPLAIRRSVDGPKPIVVPQEPKTLLVQSYRTISLKDVQESALQIYRKFLIQLRTASMAAEEAVSSSKRAFSAPGLPRGSVDGVAQRWDGYAEQVIAEWNEKWRDCGPEARRLRRLSGRTGVSERGDGDHDEDFKNEKDQGFGYKESGSEQGLSEEQMAREEAMAKRRSITGFTAFLNRLLRTETTILELPTLTINTITVEEEAAASDESEDSGDEEEDYDSDIDDDDEEDDEEVEGNIARKDVGVPPRKDSEIELQAVVTTEMPTQSKEAETIGGSTAADSRRSSTSTSHSSCSHTSEQKLEHEGKTLTTL